MSGQREFLEQQAAIESKIQWEQEREAAEREKVREKRESRRFWINTAISAVSALGAVAAAIFAGIAIFC